MQLFGSRIQFYVIIFWKTTNFIQWKYEITAIPFWGKEKIDLPSCRHTFANHMLNLQCFVAIIYLKHTVFNRKYWILPGQVPSCMKYLRLYFVICYTFFSQLYFFIYFLFRVFYSSSLLLISKMTYINVPHGVYSVHLYGASIRELNFPPCHIAYTFSRSFPVSIFSLSLLPK